MPHLDPQQQAPARPPSPSAAQHLPQPTPPASTAVACGAPTGSPDDLTLRAPGSPGELFRVFNRLALQGFGGVLPIAQRELVERARWLTREQFVELLSVAQVLPGPNVVNLALMYGDRTFGWRGGLAALAGMIAAPLGVVLALTLAYAHFRAYAPVAGALRGMGAVAAGLIFATGVKLAPALRRNALGMGRALGFAAFMFLAIAVLRVPLLWALLVLGGLSCTLAWRRLRP